ncbi:MAG: ribonuclease P protein subunit [Archaeoglobaceae archaeon]|nr:ribonuclease P protein subunit [Archaeoglobaceae archaeon]MCX8151457.1 ribonuclease P protein subunit [Archaeoglobaceae archaeon]MDW8014219.1 ribonuclease P protein subunit [Archaeoglobaceae archaeon]
MRRELQSLIARDWIGLKVEVVESPNESEVGIAGEVVDETMWTLKIMTEKGLKIVAKKGRTFKVWFMEQVVKISGNLITFRPEDRIKRGLMLLKRAKGVKV